MGEACGKGMSEQDSPWVPLVKNGHQSYLCEVFHKQRSQ